MWNTSKRASVLVVAALTALGMLAPIGTPQANAGGGNKYASIAYSPQTDRYGAAYCRDCLADAQNDAVANADADDAMVVASVQNGWVALAVGDNGSYGAAYSTRSLGDAEASALTYCGLYNRPHIVVWCSSQ